MNKTRTRRWQTAQDRARVAAELIEEAESLTDAAVTVGTSAPANGGGNGNGSASPGPVVTATAAPVRPRPMDGTAALAEADRALAADPENPTLLQHRAGALAALGRFAAAQQDLLQVLRLQPDEGGALVGLGVLLSRRGLWAQAAAHLRRATEIDPALAAAWYHLGEALNHIDDLAGALDALERAAALEPRNPRICHSQGVVLDRLRRPADATVMYRRAREVTGR